MKGVIRVNRVNIDRKLCKACGICIEFCPKKVFTARIDGSPDPQHQENCIGCKLCELRCPDFAIEVEVFKDVK